MTQALIFIGIVLFVLPFVLLMAMVALTNKATPKPEVRILAEAREHAYQETELVA